MSRLTEADIRVLIPSRGFWCFEALVEYVVIRGKKLRFNPLTGILVF